MKHSPFHRARMMFSLIAAAFQVAVGSNSKLQELLGVIKPYESRGKGQGGRFLGSSSRYVAMDKRDAKKARNQARHKRAVKGAKR